MAEEKKRFPWWWVVCAAILLPLAAALGFIETVGRKGTIVGRWELIAGPDEGIKKGTSRAETFRVLGEHWREGRLGAMGFWNDGPAHVAVSFDGDDRAVLGNLVMLPPYEYKGSLTWWNLRRWAERTYTAIHGPRR